MTVTMRLPVSVAAVLAMAASLCVLPLAGQAAEAAASPLFKALQQEKAALQKQVQDLRVALDAEQRKAAALQAGTKQAQADRAALQAELAELQGREREVQATAERHRTKAEQLIAIVGELRDLLASQADAIAAHQEQTTGLQVQRQKLAGEAASAQSVAQQAQSQAVTLQQQLEQTVARTSRERATMHYNMGVVFDRGLMYRAAEEQYLKCVALQPDDAEAHYNLGILYDDKLANPTQAIAHYQRFLALRPSGEDAVAVQGWIEALQGE